MPARSPSPRLLPPPSRAGFVSTAVDSPIRRRSGRRRRGDEHRHAYHRPVPHSATLRRIGQSSTALGSRSLGPWRYGVPRGALVTKGGEQTVFEIPVAYQIVIVAAVLAGLGVWFAVFVRL